MIQLSAVPGRPRRVSRILLGSIVIVIVVGCGAGTAPADRASPSAPAAGDAPTASLIRPAPVAAGPAGPSPVPVVPRPGPVTNTSPAPTQRPIESLQARLKTSIGVFYNGTDAVPDLQAWPNGRRLSDDVVDMELRAVADGYGPILNSLFHLPNNSPNNIVGDGVNANDQAFLSAFPYIATPNQGYSHAHHAMGVIPL